MVSRSTPNFFGLIKITVSQQFDLPYCASGMNSLPGRFPEAFRQNSLIVPLGWLSIELKLSASWNPTYSKPVPLQNDQSSSNHRKVKLLQELVKNAKDVRKQRRMNAKPNDTVVAI